MALSFSKREFLKSEAATSLRNQLELMVEDPQYNTQLRYSTTEPDGSLFVTRHMEYMSNYPQMNHIQYVSNLKLKTRLAIAR